MAGMGKYGKESVKGMLAEITRIFLAVCTLFISSAKETNKTCIFKKIHPHAEHVAVK
jgi:hypothetical protein